MRASANRLFNRYLSPGGAGGFDRPRRAAAVPEHARRDPGQGRGDRRRAARGRKRNQARALARRYFDRAVEFLRYRPPGLVVIGGLSGVGKSALAGALAPELGRAPGALWLRSDLERKAMFAVEETVHLPASAYAADVTREVYRRLIDKARIAFRAGQAVLLDATFATAAERSGAAGAAAEVGVAFAGLFLDAPLATRLERIGSRRADASDADGDVARRQKSEPLRERGWAALEASGTLSETTDLARARLSRAVATGESERAPRAVSLDRPAGIIVMKCSCWVQWNRGMRTIELGASPSWERAGEIAGAPVSEGLTIVRRSPGSRYGPFSSPPPSLWARPTARPRRA